MNEIFKNNIENRWQQIEKRRKHGRIWAGLFLLIVGGLWLLKTLNIVFFPAWFLTWPVFLIALGLFIGAKHSFRGGGWLIPIIIGGFVLMDDINPSLNLNRFIAPVVLITIGLAFILRPKRNNWRRWRHYHEGDWQQMQQGGAPTDKAYYAGDRSDFIDVTAVFGGVKKNLLSKTFKGGDITAVMGGAEINLSQADFNGKVMIDCFNMFGGTKLIIPPDWEVQSDIVAIFGGVDDKRPPVSNAAPNKVLYLDGTCMFGGIEIRSF